MYKHVVFRVKIVNVVPMAIGKSTFHVLHCELRVQKDMLAGKFCSFGRATPVIPLGHFLVEFVDGVHTLGHCSLVGFRVAKTVWSNQSTAYNMCRVFGLFFQ